MSKTKEIFNKLKYTGKLKITITVCLIAITVAIGFAGTQNLQFFRGSTGDINISDEVFRSRNNNNTIYNYDPADPAKGLKINVQESTQESYAYVVFYIVYNDTQRVPVGYGRLHNNFKTTFYLCGFQNVDISLNCISQRTAANSTPINNAILLLENTLLVRLYTSNTPINNISQINFNNTRDLGIVHTQARLHTQPKLTITTQENSSSLSITVNTDIPSLCEVTIIGPEQSGLPTIRVSKNQEHYRFNIWNISNWSDLERHISTRHVFNIPKQIPSGIKYNLAKLSIKCSNIFLTQRYNYYQIELNHNFFLNSNFFKQSFQNPPSITNGSRLEFKTRHKGRCGLVRSNFQMPPNIENTTYSPYLHFPTSWSHFRLSDLTVNNTVYDTLPETKRSIPLTNDLLNQSLKLMCVILDNNNQYATDTVVYSLPFQPTAIPQSNTPPPQPQPQPPSLPSQLQEQLRGSATPSNSTLQPNLSTAPNLNTDSLAPVPPTQVNHTEEDFKLNLHEPQENNPNTPLNQTFSWQPIRNTTQYIFQIRLKSSSNFNTFLVHSNSFRSNRLTLDSNTEYEWRVCAVVPTSKLPCSNIQNFKTTSN